MKILVTGLSGFIGGYLKDRLGDKHELHDLECDLRDHQAVGDRVHYIEPDVIVHLAARTEVEMSFYEQTTFSDINYTGTVNLIEKSKSIKNLKLFLFASTMETYGWQPFSDRIRDDQVKWDEEIPAFTEETIQHPNAPYAVAKLGCEKYLEYASRAYDFPFAALRQTNTYGRNDNDFFVVEQIITQMLQNPDEINLGYGKPYRNFLYIEDLIDLYCNVIENPDKARNEIFCTGPNNALSIEQLVDVIAKKLDWNGTVNWNTKPKRHGEIFLLNSTNDKATDILGWEPKVDLDTGLDITIDIWKNKLQKQ